MKRALIRIDLVVVAKHQAHPDVHQLIASEETTLHRVSNPALDGLDVLLGNSAASNLVFENKPLTRGRFDLDLHMAKLATAAGLLFIDLFAGRRRSEERRVGKEGRSRGAQ